MALGASTVDIVAGSVQNGQVRAKLDEKKGEAKEESARFDRALYAYINAPIPLLNPEITKRTQPATPNVATKSYSSDVSTIPEIPNREITKRTMAAGSASGGRLSP